MSGVEILSLSGKIAVEQRQEIKHTCISGERMLQEKAEAGPGRSKYQQEGRCGEQMPRGRVTRVRCIIMILEGHVGLPQGN